MHDAQNPGSDRIIPLENGEENSTSKANKKKLKENKKLKTQSKSCNTKFTAKKHHIQQQRQRRKTSNLKLPFIAQMYVSTNGDILRTRTSNNACLQQKQQQQQLAPTTTNNNQHCQLTITKYYNQPCFTRL